MHSVPGPGPSTSWETSRQENCRACGKAPELQPHLLQCEKLSNSEIVSDPIDYEDIHSEDSKKVAALARILMTKHDQFKKQIKPSEPDMQRSAHK